MVDKYISELIEESIIKYVSKPKNKHIVKDYRDHINISNLYIIASDYVENRVYSWQDDKLDKKFIDELVSSYFELRTKIIKKAEEIDKKIICNIEGCTLEFNTNTDRSIHITRFHLPIEDQEEE